MPNNDSLLNRYVLYTLYFATTGNEWKDSSNWLSSILPECTWFGIHCEVDTNIIHTIELHFNNLDGTIPTEIALLPNLGKDNKEALLGGTCVSTHISVCSKVGLGVESIGWGAANSSWQHDKPWYVSTSQFMPHSISLLILPKQSL